MQLAAIQSASGLRWLANRNGALRRIDHGDITINLFPGNEVEGGISNLYLRTLEGERIEAAALLGPRSVGTVHVTGDGIGATGQWRGLRYRLSLRMAADVPAWFWHLSLENTGAAAVTADLIYVQDVGLAHYGALRNNEYYLSQYVDMTPLEHPKHGCALAMRQNLPMNGRHPWLMVGSFRHALSFATDALHFYGLSSRAGHGAAGLTKAQLPGQRLQHEHALAALQDEPFTLAPGARKACGFFGWVEANHDTASSIADLRIFDDALVLPEAEPADLEGIAVGARPASSLFSAAPLFVANDLEDHEVDGIFAVERRHEERRDGELLSFFYGQDRHVVLRAKEVRSLRQHGHILRTGAAMVPEEEALSTTVWMNGTFNSLVTQGHCNINRFLSTSRGYLGMFRSHGQRVFVEFDDGFHLLDVPSAFEMAPSECRWVYQFPTGRIDVSCFVPVGRHEIELSIRVVDGEARRFLVSHHVALAGDDADRHEPAIFDTDERGVTVRPPADSDIGRRFPKGNFRIDVFESGGLERIAGDEALFLDGQSRGQPFVSILLARTRAAGLRIRGRLVETDVSIRPQSSERDPESDRRCIDAYWRGLTANTVIRGPAGSSLAADVERLTEILPWLAHNALIHYLSPHGLEQYSNGGWGTRDVSQGPVELFLALERHADVRALLLRIFAAQNRDGDWPQWFMFFERESQIRAPDSHGDIVFWPVLALAQYLLASDDGAILDELLPFHEAGEADGAPPSTLAEHVECALALIAKRVIPGTHLAAYGHGDWNDSLQPADPSMAVRLCSAWTVTLHSQTLTTLAAALTRIGKAEEARRLAVEESKIRKDFQRLLISSDVLAGFAYFHDDGRIDRILHPEDETTGLRFRLLPMIHAIINDLLTPPQARTHSGIIRDHLLGVDGARLFDRPPTYRGGPERHFRRAESSPFFGREIGVMYMHAHLRYAESMAHYGDADAFFLALRQMNPILLQEAVPTATLRQANCYHSSSDAAFPDRYQAAARYGEVKSGDVAFEGGWRIYSSGAGIASRLVRQCFLGLRASRTELVVDPVIPEALDGMEAATDLFGTRFRVIYRTGRLGRGPVAITLNGVPVAFETETNPYRRGGARVARSALDTRADVENVLTVELE